MPARYRDEIFASCEGRLVITVDLSGCLIIFPQPEWERKEAELMSLPNMDPKVRQLQRLYVGHAHEVEMSAQGRILVSPALRQVASLQKQVTLVGQGAKFELWDTEKWTQQTASILESADALLEVSDSLTSFSL